MFKPKPGFRIELHILKSHAASNLNRDGSNRPKTIYIGGCRRLRISSQAEKYSIRHSDIFIQFLDDADQKYGATKMVRTRHAASSIKKNLKQKIQALGKDPEAYEDQINQGLNSFQNLFSRQQNQHHCDEGITQLIAFSKAEIEYIADIMFDIDQHGEIVIKDVSQIIAQLNKERTSIGPLSPELQLFGRFITASHYLKNIDTPLQVSHGFTVHETRIEQDYWTAVDDLNINSNRQGGGHLDSRPFGAGVFYHYYCLDVPLLSKNIAGAFAALSETQNVELTRDIIAAFLYAALCRNPVGSQTSHANLDMPSCAYITYGNAFPYCAQNAFERPVNRAQGGGYYAEAKLRFTDWLEERKKRYGIFCGFEQSMGIGDTNTDLKTMIETTVEEATPVIRSTILKV